MPYGDRYWWLKLVAAPLVAGLAIAAPWWYAVTIALADAAVGIPASADRWFIIGLGAALALTALYLVVSGLRGRARQRRRRAAKARTIAPAKWLGLAARVHNSIDDPLVIYRDARIVPALPLRDGRKFTRLRDVERKDEGQMRRGAHHSIVWRVAIG